MILCIEHTFSVIAAAEVALVLVAAVGAKITAAVTDKIETHLLQVHAAAATFYF